MSETVFDNMQYQLWDAEQDILDTVHSFCEMYNLKYSLAYGTLIGAVRHSGFIPWDDDIDIMMPRDDYDKLIKIWKKSGPEGYILETKELYRDIVNNHAKIRKDKTTFLQFESERYSKHHKGIFIDIFPVDRVAPGKVTRKLQYLAFAANILYSRGYISGTGKLLTILGNIMLKITPQNLYYTISSKAEKLGAKWNRKHDAMLVAPCTIGSCHDYYPSSTFDKLIKMKFRNHEYYVFQNYDIVLKTVYNDYMQLPPKEEQIWGHHPIILDFEHNYEDLVGREKQNV